MHVRCALVLIVCLLVAAPCGAVSETALSLKRLIHRYDFEDERNGVKIARAVSIHPHFFAIGREPDIADPNFLRLKVHRQLANAEGYPRYGEVGFDGEHATSGDFSLRLGLRGGNVGSFVRIGSIPAVPRSDYLVTATVRTESLKHARARLQAFFVDPEGRVIEPSVASTRLLDTDGQWRKVAVSLRGDFREAAWIGLRVDVLQPRPTARGPAAKHEVVLKDVHGDAWFDDIAVWQVPRIVVRSQSPVGVIRAPLKPKLSLEVRDLTGQALLAKVNVYDFEGRRVDGMKQAVGAGGPSKWPWRPKIERYGWYLVDLALFDVETSTTTPVAREVGSLLYLPDRAKASAGTLRHLGIDASGLPMAQLKLLPQVLDETGLGATVISAWRRQTRKADIESEQYEIDGIVQSIAGGGRRLRMSFSPVPQELTEAMGVDDADPFYVFQQPREVWLPYAAPVFVRHGQVIRQWQLGSADEPSIFFAPQLRQRVDAVTSHIAELAPTPTVHLPWSITQQRDKRLDDGLAYFVDVPHGVIAEDLAAYLGPWTKDPAAAVELRLRVRPATELTQKRRVTDMVLRMLHAWEAGVPRMTLSGPWTKSTTDDYALYPDPTLGAFTQVGQLLRGRRVLGRLPVGDGLQCMIFDGPRGGMLAIWNESAPPAKAVVRMHLGEQPVAVDVWGNRKPVAAKEGRHRLAVGRTPVFVEGVDAKLAMFRASFRMVEDFIESNQRPQDRKIVLHNPWGRTISGSITISGLDDWRISPRRSFFNIAAGQSTEIDVRLALPITEVAGRKQLTADFDFLAGRRYVIEASTPFDLGLREADFDANVTLEPNPQTGEVDVVITQMIANTGFEAISIYAFANMKGHPRQERIVSRLEPGESVVRRFRFQDAAADLKQSPVRVGLRETQGPSILNKLLSYDDL